jgi:hypothetical protein
VSWKGYQEGIQENLPFLKKCIFSKNVSEKVYLFENESNRRNGVNINHSILNNFDLTKIDKKTLKI